MCVSIRAKPEITDRFHDNCSGTAVNFAGKNNKNWIMEQAFFFRKVRRRTFSLESSITSSLSVSTLKGPICHEDFSVFGS